MIALDVLCATVAVAAAEWERRRLPQFPTLCAYYVATGCPFGWIDYFLHGLGVQFLGDVVVTVWAAHVLWAWWRMRRQGRPSKVAGLVRDLGHRLAVVAVPAGAR